MKAMALVVLLLVALTSSFVGVFLNIGQKDVISSLKIIYLENDDLRLTWNLLNPSGAVRGFSLTWNDGASDKQAHESGTEATIGYPSNLDCSDKLTVTVIPLNDDNVPIGTTWTEKFALHDVVTNIVLTPAVNTVSASWSIKCPSQVHTETVVIWEELSHSHQLSCHFPSTAMDTTVHGVCPAGELILQPCQKYYVFIEPLDSESSYTGIAGRGLSYTLEEVKSKVDDVINEPPKDDTAAHVDDEGNDRHILFIDVIAPVMTLAMTAFIILAVCMVPKPSAAGHRQSPAAGHRLPTAHNSPTKQFEAEPPRA